VSVWFGAGVVGVVRNVSASRSKLAQQRPSALNPLARELPAHNERSDEESVDECAVSGEGKRRGRGCWRGLNDSPVESVEEVGEVVLYFWREQAAAR